MLDSLGQKFLISSNRREREQLGVLVLVQYIVLVRGLLLDSDGHTLCVVGCNSHPTVPPLLLPFPVSGARVGERGKRDNSRVM